MHITLDKKRFETWSKIGCSNSEYSFVRTLCCSKICVEDNELHELFYDSSDSTKKMNLWTSSLSCPICGESKWEVSDISEPLNTPEQNSWHAVTTQQS